MVLIGRIGRKGLCRTRRDAGGSVIRRALFDQIHASIPRDFEYNGRPAQSAIWKYPVMGRVAARRVNLVGDDQADRQAHGGPDKAVYAYAVEDLTW